MAVALDDEGAPSIIPSGLPSFGPTSGLLAGGDAGRIAEAAGRLCRDAGPAGLAFFPNRFLA